MTRTGLSSYKHGAAVFSVLSAVVIATGSSVYDTSKCSNGLCNVTDTDVIREVAAPTEVCSTETCKATAKKILSYINTTADPCEDFYDYACGKWPLLHKLPDNETESSAFHDLDEKMKLIVQGLLGRNNSGAFASETTAKTIYKQCLNQAEIEKLRAKPLISLLDDLIGGWPVITPSWNPNKFDLLTSLINLRLYGEESLFSFDVDQDLETPKRNVIYLSGPEGFTTREVLESDAGKKYADSYRTFLINATSLLLRDNGDTRLVSAVLPDLTEIVDLSKFLILNGQTAIDKANLTLMKNKTKLGTVQENILFRSNLAQSLTTYMKAVFQAVHLSKQINSNTDTVISYPTFFHLLDKKLLELQNLNNEGKRQLANFIGWRVITNNIRYFSKDYRDAYEEHVGRVQGQKVKREPTAAERCAKDLIAMMPLTVGAIYVRDNVSIDLKPKASMMMKDLKQGFETLLVAATWMDSTTFAKATQKLAAMIDFVGYPDVMVTNTSAIDEEYKEIIVRHTYFDTVRDASKNQNFRSLRLLTKQNIRDDPFRGEMDITEVNAFNSLQKNLIVILAAALQLPFYDPNDPQYVNYGGIGFIIGHEITHGFDNQGATCDDQGGLHSWWTENTTRIYDMKKRGISEQYGNYSFPFGKVDGELTLGENIADNGGIKAAYVAYNIYRSRLTQPEAPVIGLETFTDDQLFFLSVGQVWCAEVRPETQRLNLLINEHSPPRFRVNGPLSNMPEFSAAFHCPVGSNMNPVVKQAVW